MFLLHRGGRQGENNNCINIISYTVKPFGSLYEKIRNFPCDSKFDKNAYHYHVVERVNRGSLNMSIAHMGLIK